MRIKFLRVIITFFLIVLAMDLFYVQVIRGSIYYRQSVNNRIRVVPMPGVRGRIKDCQGIVLAENRLSFNVAVLPQDVREREKLFTYLSRALGIEKDKLLKQYLQKKVTPFAPVVVVEDVNRRLAMALEENRYQFPGLYIQETFRRHYPFGAVGAHILGYVGKITEARMEKWKEYGYTVQSVVGYSGIEEFYDQYLRGEEGGLQIEVNSRGQQVRLLGIREPASGQDLYLTIDQRVQQAATEILGDRRGAIVMMDLDSGEVLGLVSSPSYDPNVFTDRERRTGAAAVFRDEGSPMLNRGIAGLYPPGSVFKCILTVAGLISGKINPHSSFVCPGYYPLGKRKFQCAHVHGTQDLLSAIAHSCNVYFFNIGEIIGPDYIEKYARLFGLGIITKIDLPGEEKGNIPGRVQRKIKFNQGWHKGDTLNYSIGQGDVLVTPVQMVRMMATIAREGQEVQPHVIKDIGEQNIVKLSTVRVVTFPPGVYKILKDGLRLVVTDEGGTARLLDMPGYGISGKTGTAQSVPGRDNHAWFVGYTQEGKRRVVFCVFLEYGGSSYNAVVLSQELLTRLREQDIL